ncbi:MAG: CARDB domain-containing protein [Nitrospirota bacterium]
MAPAAEPADAVLTGIEQPGGVWSGVPALPALRQTEPSWSLRTGFRKGVTDQSLEEEAFAGPDAAVLRTGSYAAWTVLLAEYRESAVLVDPDNLAGLAATKPLLIIPSGGLAGLSASSFFRAGLAEYVRSGGIVLCFAQQKGEAYASLPVPEGSKAVLSGAGWAEDSGPLFRSSSLQDAHPILAELRKATPSLETDGYLTTYPESGRVLLARQDGFPTFVLYAVGKGWVAVTSLMSDVSFEQGLLADDERALVRGMVLWAKSGGRTVQLAAVGQLTATLRVRGPEEGEASSVRTQVIGPFRNKPREERTIPFPLKASEEASLPFVYGIPSDAEPGIYHVEYVLQDEKKRPLSAPAEAGGGWFAVMPSSPPPTAIARTAKPLAALPAGFTAEPAIEHLGDRVKISLEVRRTSGPAGAYDLFARLGGQERPFKITGDRAVISAEVPLPTAGSRLSYAVYHANGRSLSRGSVPVVVPRKSGIHVDRPWYRPGEKVRVSVTGMGAGELSLTGFGSVVRAHTGKNKVYELSVPKTLPTGNYPLTWAFQTTAGALQEGELSVAIQGARVVCKDVSVRSQSPRSSASFTASFRFSSSQAQQAVLHVQPFSPDGRLLPGRETSVSLPAGDTDIDLSVPFEPDRAGIWSFRYTLTARLPEGPGFSPEPVMLLSGRVFHDAGIAALLALYADRPLYYEASGQVSLTAITYGTGPAKVELFLDGKRIRKETIEARGVTSFTMPLSGLSLGIHTLRAAASGDALESGRDIRLIYGARLPDLTVTIKPSETIAPILEIGVGIINQGKVASGHVLAALYEGDPAAGGTLIRQVPVPPLAPGKQYVFIVKWPLAGKAGPRSLVAVVDRDAQIMETNKGNNNALFSLTIPDVLLNLVPDKASFRSDEQVRYRVNVVNFTTETFSPLTVKLQTADPSGKTVATDTLSMPDFAPGAEQKIDRTLGVPAPREGIYIISGQAITTKPVTADSLGVVILPTLQLNGTLEGTPLSAAPCRPISVHYAVRDAGNVQPTNGSLKIEVRSSATKQLVYAQQLPFSLDARTHRIEKIDFPRGAYTVSLRASAVNQPRALTADFLLAEQPLTVSGPVEIKRSTALMPRILILAGGENSTAIEQAVMEKLLKESFEQEGAYVKTVATVEDFAVQALTGVFNTYVLFEINGMLDTVEAVRSGLARGHGVMVAGSGERSRAVAEALGFEFGPALSGNIPGITFSGTTGLGLSGTMPISGSVLPPRKRGAQPVAVFPDGRPAVLLDVVDKGKTIVIPFSLTQSALSAGTTSPFSLLLRSAVLAVAPAQEAAGSVASVQLLVSSPSGPVRAQIIETLPRGAKVLWTNIAGASSNGALTFELTAGPEPQRIVCLFQPADPAAVKTASEVFSECDGKLVSQGKVE